MTTHKLTGNRCQYKACGEHFIHARAFDRHRIGKHCINGRSLIIPEMRARGWQHDAVGYQVLSALNPACRSRIGREQLGVWHIPSRKGGAGRPRKPTRISP